MDKTSIKSNDATQPDIQPENTTVDPRLAGRKLAEAHRLEFQTSSGGKEKGIDRKIRTFRQEASISSRVTHIDAILKEAVGLLRDQTSVSGDFSLAREWLLDNYYIANQALRAVEQDLPSNYENQLPRLRAGILRIYDIATRILRSENGLLGLEHVQRFLEAYQETLPLTMGELWALPIMLRLSILEYLTSAIARIVGIEKDEVTKLGLNLNLPEGSDDELWVENSIRSLRILAVNDWKECFEALSLVDHTLRQDPARLYAGMDFRTRDAYRKVVEQIAKSGQGDELGVARIALELARTKANQRISAQPFDPQIGSSHDYLSQAFGWDSYRTQPEVHVGYYLLGQGRPALERAAGYTEHGAPRFGRLARTYPTFFYLGGVIAIMFGLMILPLFYVAQARAPAVSLLLVFILALIPALTISVDVVNWIVTQLIKPKNMLRMDFSKGLPKECAAVVVIPALLSGREEVESLLAQLELHFLRNSDPQLSFALLTDFPDAPSEKRPEDTVLVNLARQGIRRLNSKYPRTEFGTSGEDRISKGRFALLQRNRRWNPSEGTWMGWERKRGKLYELNRSILAAQGILINDQEFKLDSSFPIHEGDLSFLKYVRYVITLDADTILPREAARDLVAVMAHPLNRARLEPTGEEECGEKVVAGYTILQPRTDINPLSSNLSIFTRIFSGDTGLDLYTRAVSDVYQDLFGEGSYVGKGIYDIRGFEFSLDGCISENTLLSHDLLEGIHGRAGLVTSITLIEDLPPTYLVHAQRLHRWIRGDWQLLPWLFSRRLSMISRWKMLDNLRRSLVACSLLAWFLAGWFIKPLPAGIWTIGGMSVLAVPVLTGFFGALYRSIHGKPVRQMEAGFTNSLIRWLLALTFLPFEAQLAADAIVKTLVRLGITRRGLLRWMTSDQAVRKMKKQGVLENYRRMYFVPVFAILIALLLSIIRSETLAWAVPFLLAWFLSPAISGWISQPLPRHTEQLDGDQKQELRQFALRTWLFFEEFIGPEDHWLPPDHFQENPLGIVAHRTSPTNIGIALLSALGAYDLGYLDGLTLSTSLTSSLDTMEKLERHRGHFLNWYDTSNMEPLQPRYVSTVDSGNLAACLLVLRQGCLEIPGHPAVSWKSFKGMLDAFNMLDGIFIDMHAPALRPRIQKLRDKLHSITQEIRAVKDEPEKWVSILAGFISNEKGKILNSDKTELDQLIIEFVEHHAQEMGPENLRRMRFYNRHLRQQINNLQRYINLLLPWHIFLREVPAIIEKEEIIPSSLEKDWQSLKTLFPNYPSLAEIPEVCRIGRLIVAKMLDNLQTQSGSGWEEALTWLKGIDQALDTAKMMAEILRVGFEELARRCDILFQAMDFSFLYDIQRQVFHIGYNVTAASLDLNYYDLLASEARIASLVAIAKGDVPQSHWLHLGRPVMRDGGRQALISWGATMFEYLMPRLFLQSDPDTLLGQTLEVVVDHQVRYGNKKNVPWGISESGYYRFDANQFYQYRAFGVPGLGYKRGLADDLVISPYASVLALALRPHTVLQNLDRLRQIGALGMYGFYEAVDFTSTRLALGQEKAIVKSYMAHHQGMILLSLVNYLAGETMVQRFQSDPRIQSVELLLLERIPRDAPIENLYTAESQIIRPTRPKVLSQPWQVDPFAPQPRIHYLSNGNYSVLITAAGGGFSTWEDIDLTRWRADTTLDNWGTWIYTQDQESGDTWSAGYQPAQMAGDEHTVLFNSHQAEFHRRIGPITQTTEIFVAPQDDVEIRMVTLTNHGDKPRSLRVTSYGEPVLVRQINDVRHPAFNKLFIESEPLPRGNGLLFHRRPRSMTEEEVYLAHILVAGPGEDTLVRPRLVSDRGHFLGRGRTSHSPSALEIDSPAVSGFNLDPIFSISQPIYLPPHATIQLAFLTTAGRSAEKCRTVLERYSSMSAIQAALERSRSLAEAEMNELKISSSALEEFQTLLSSLLFPSHILRANSERLAENQKGQPGLWPFAISGDYPILLAELSDEDELLLARDLLKAHTYWRRRKLMIDLVFMDLQGTSYNQEFSAKIYRLIASMESEGWLNRRGGIYLLHADQMSAPDRVLLETAARVIMKGSHESLSALLQHNPALHHKPSRLPTFTPITPAEVTSEPTASLSRPSDLLYDNGLGGFSVDGKEYCIYLKSGQTLPLPWINVIANPQFGFLASESGLGASWAENSGENRLSPWRNDPITNTPSEVVYLRDEETAVVWSPTPQPTPDSTPYLIHHGAGYTIYEHISQGLHQKLRVFSPPDAPIKILFLQLENLEDRQRRITATYYVELVLGVNREDTQQYLIPEFHSNPEALLVRNPYNSEFSGRVAFIMASNPLHGLTADRTEFLGRLGSIEQPAALGRIGLSGTVRAGLDPCAALQLHIDIAPGGSEQIYFILGQAEDQERTMALVYQYRDWLQIQAAWEANLKFWNELLETIQVHTPEPSFDLLINRWLLYQTLVCRIWGRTAFYQSSGAYGFRDQLQDVMAILYTAPQLAREHLLRAARHQFEAGDVLHWWHPPSGRGVRTRISDDLLWLPYVTAEYVHVTGDEKILMEKVPFRVAQPLEMGQEEHYGQFPETGVSYTLFEHCQRALVKGMAFGSHNLPLMGSGDWNDGMNRVGIEGRGESVWLGWFLYSTLNRFADLCEQIGQDQPAADYRQNASDLALAIEQRAWDGNWYLRAFYDDGTPLGSQENLECQIDAIAQSWGVLSGGGNPQRTARAMQSVIGHLVQPDQRLVLLFTPPFDKTLRDPGYIKGYPPGVRENGGQYNHAALWSAWALANLGRIEESFQLFQFINPILNADTSEKIARYQVEPYVVAADVYSAHPFTGHGGWTWYTGSSGWMYRLGLEGYLGLKKRGDHLEVDPHIPRDWPGFRVTYQTGKSTYDIQVQNPEHVHQGVKEITLNGQLLLDKFIPLSHNEGIFRVIILMG